MQAVAHGTAEAIDIVIGVQAAASVAATTAVVHEHDVDVGRKIQLGPAQFAQRDNGKAKCIPGRIVQAAEALLKIISMPAQRRLHTVLGQPRQLGQSGAQISLCIDIAPADAQRFGLAVTAQILIELIQTGRLRQLRCTDAGLLQPLSIQ